MSDVIRDGRQEPLLPGRELDGDRLTAIIESRMSGDLAWLGDDGKTITRMNPEQVGWALAHLYRTGDVVSGLPPQDIEQAERDLGEALALLEQAKPATWHVPAPCVRCDIDAFLRRHDAQPGGGDREATLADIAEAERIRIEEQGERP